MMWTLTHFPAAMRSLHPSTRASAIEIANELIGKAQMEQQQAIRQGINEARSIARRTALADTGSGYFSVSRR
jgi:uncharacterized protein YdaT